MENTNACSDSWQSDSSVSPRQSQWLQTTLSDLEEKMKAMLTVIEENCDHLAPPQPEMFCQKKQQLTQMIEEFCGSYRSLAEKYDQLSSESTHDLNSGSSSLSSNSRKIQHFTINMETVVGSSSIFEAFDSHPESVVEDPEGEFDVTNLNCGSQLERLKGENRALRSCLRSSNNCVKRNQSHKSILKGRLSLCKFFRGGDGMI